MWALLGITIFLLCAAGLYSLCSYIDSKIDPAADIHILPIDYRERSLQEEIG